jgi:hypothetical protein
MDLDIESRHWSLITTTSGANGGGEPEASSGGFAESELDESDSMETFAKAYNAKKKKHEASYALPARNFWSLAENVSTQSAMYDLKSECFAASPTGSPCAIKCSKPVITLGSDSFVSEATAPCVIRHGTNGPALGT